MSEKIELNDQELKLISELNGDAGEAPTPEDSAPEDSAPVSDTPPDEIPNEPPVDEDDDDGDDWRVEVKDLAASYGFADEDLAEMGSRDEFERAGALVDKRMLEMSVSPSPPADATPPEQEQKTEPEAEADDREKAEALWKEIENSDDYEPNFKFLAKQTRLLQEQLDRERAEASQASVNEAQLKEVQLFDQVVDNLGLDVVGQKFDDEGKAKELPQAAFQVRGGLYQRVLDLRALEQSRTGSDPGMTNEIIRRAARVELAKEFQEQESRKRKENLSSQSARRRSVGVSGRNQDAKLNRDPHDPANIANHPDFDRFD